MPHTKPQVIIDLDEYNALKRFKDEEFNTFHLAITTIGQFYSTKYPDLSIEELNKYLREKAKVNLVRKEGGLIELIKVL